MKHLISALLFIIIMYAISWAITTGFIWLICLCFSAQFNLLTATGIWCVLLLLEAVLKKK